MINIRSSKTASRALEEVDGGIVLNMDVCLLLISTTCVSLHQHLPPHVWEGRLCIFYNSCASQLFSAPFIMWNGWIVCCSADVIWCVNICSSLFCAERCIVSCALTHFLSRHAASHLQELLSCSCA